MSAGCNLSARCSKVLCDNNKLGSYVLLENNGFDLGKDGKWNVVDASSERDIWSNHYVPSSLRSESFVNPFNSKAESGEDFVWESKGNSIQNSAWIGAVKKTEVASNLEEYGDYWENIGGSWGKEKYKIGSVGDDN